MYLMFYSRSFIHQLYPNKAGTSRRGDDQREGPCWNVVTTSGSPRLAPLLGSDSGYSPSLPDCLSQTCPWSSYTGEGGRNRMTSFLGRASALSVLCLVSGCVLRSTGFLASFSEVPLFSILLFFLNLNLRLFTHRWSIYRPYLPPVSPSSFS